MRAVSDTSPLSNLAVIGRLSLRTKDKFFIAAALEAQVLAVAGE